MPRDKTENHIKIIAAAKAEFIRSPTAAMI